MCVCTLLDPVVLVVVVVVVVVVEVVVVVVCWCWEKERKYCDSRFVRSFSSSCSVAPRGKGCGAALSLVRLLSGSSGSSWEEGGGGGEGGEKRRRRREEDEDEDKDEEEREEGGREGRGEEILEKQGRKEHVSQRTDRTDGKEK